MTTRGLRLRRCLLVVWLVMMLSGVLAAACEAGTLYERSLAEMEKRVQMASPRDFTFVVMGDSRGNDPVFTKALALAASLKPLFVLHTGDFSVRGSVQETDHFLSLVQNALPDIPLFVVPGNHEQRGPFREKIGPLNYVIDAPRLGLKVIVVDNSTYALKAPERLYLTSQLSQKRKLTFVAMHIPPRTSRWSWHTFTDGAADLTRLLAGANVTAAFYGHVHLYDRDNIGGVEHLITGGAGAPLTRYDFPGNASDHVVVVKVKDGSVSYATALIDE